MPRVLSKYVVSPWYVFPSGCAFSSRIYRRQDERRKKCPNENDLAARGDGLPRRPQCDDAGHTRLRGAVGRRRVLRQRGWLAGFPLVTEQPPLPQPGAGCALRRDHPGRLFQLGTNQGHPARRPGRGT